MVTNYPLYFLFVCPVVGLIYAFVLYFLGRNRFSRVVRIILASLRFVCVSALVFLLFSPVVRRTVQERRQPHVVLAVDASLSVKMSSDSLFSLASLVDQLSPAFRFSIDTFGNAGYTDIAAALSRHALSDADAVVLASDGIFNRGANPASVAERLGMPVYTVALGDTSLHPDASIRDLRYNRVAMLGSSFPVELTVSASLLRGRGSVLHIFDSSGVSLFSQPVSYAEDFSTLSIQASLPTSHPGLRQYRVELVPVDGEVSVENNSASFYVDVIDSRRHVAIYSSAPHPDLGALKRAIESNPNFEASVLQVGRDTPPENCSLVILHNLPSASYPDVSFADAFPKLYILGLQTDLPRFNALHTGLDIVSKAKGKNELTAIFNPSFSLFSISPEEASAIEMFPPLDAPFGEIKSSPDVQMLFSARLGSIDTRQPFLSGTSKDALRRSFVWGEGLWRWRLADFQTHGSHEIFDRLISQLVNFTAMQHSRSRLEVQSARAFLEGESPILSAQLYNESYELDNAPELSLHLSSDSLSDDYIFSPSGSTYSLRLPQLPSGLYRYHAASSTGLVADGTFAVEALGIEQKTLVADHALLRQISASTGGECFSPSEIDHLSQALSQIKPVIYSRRHYTELINLPLFLILLLALLSVEWIGRKYSGDV